MEYDTAWDIKRRGDYAPFEEIPPRVITVGYLQSHSVLDPLQRFNRLVDNFRSSLQRVNGNGLRYAYLSFLGDRGVDAELMRLLGRLNKAGLDHPTSSPYADRGFEQMRNALAGLRRLQLGRPG